MKNYLTYIVLITFVLFSQLYNSAITVLYQLNYDYYSTQLCENQGKPELHCDGKCYFAKQLQLKEDSHDNTEPPALLPTFLLFANSFDSTDLTACLLPTKETLPSYIDLGTRSAYLSEIDHPPRD